MRCFLCAGVFHLGHFIAQQHSRSLHVTLANDSNVFPVRVFPVHRGACASQHPPRISICAVWCRVNARNEEAGMYPVTLGSLMGICGVRPLKGTSRPAHSDWLGNQRTLMNTLPRPNAAKKMVRCTNGPSCCEGAHFILGTQACAGAPEGSPGVPAAEQGATDAVGGGACETVRGGAALRRMCGGSPPVSGSAEEREYRE
eukprot:gene9438-biopygen13770